jgi:probable DNA metabolism protein
MQLVRLKKAGDFDEWRAIARDLLQRGVAPEQVDWRGADEGDSLFADMDGAAAPALTGKALSMPRALVQMADRIICHRDADVPARLYRLFWRAQTDRQLLSRKADADVHWAMQIDKAIRRDIHKMHAFVRFRLIGEREDGRERYAAWFEPSHYTLRLGAPFFQRRFAHMDWAIITPDASAIWDGEDLIFGEGGSRDDVPESDVVEDQWRTYYGAIFNPARVKINAMRAEMPKKYWHNLPEAQDIAALLADAERRVEHMRQASITSPNARAEKWQQNVAAALEGEEFAAAHVQDLPSLALALDRCRLCPLHCDATQAVAGEGPADAAVMMVGEQPGDREDLAGRPFVGPAGQLLNAALERSGFQRDQLYLTNAVKHFKFTPRGKRRLHQTPTAGEIDMCRWWLDKERELVKPEWTVTLGASALRAVAGPKAKLADLRGKPMQLEDGTKFLPTIHPSYLLRIPDEAKAAAEKQAFLRDLRLARELAN